MCYVRAISSHYLMKIYIALFCSCGKHLTLRAKNKHILILVTTLREIKSKKVFSIIIGGRLLIIYCQDQSVFISYCFQFIYNRTTNKKYFQEVI